MDPIAAVNAAHSDASSELTPLASAGAAHHAAALQVVDALIPMPTRAKRGFAVLSPEKKREIASMGGKAAHEHGRAHRFTSEEARAAGKKRHQLRLLAAAQAAAAQTAGTPNPPA